MTERNAKHMRVAKRIVLLALGLAGLAVMVAHWGRTGELIQGGDNFFGYDPLNELVKGFFAWNRLGVYIGAPWSSGTWTPWLLIALLAKAVIGISAAQLFMIWLSLAVGWLGLFFFARVVGTSDLGAFFGATIYTLNPWNQLFAGLNYPLNWLTALAPWVAYVVVLAARRPTARPGVSLALALLGFIAFPILGANPALVVLIALCGVAAAGIARFYLHLNDAWAYTVWCARTAVVTIMTSMWWLYLVALQFLGNRVAATTTAQNWTFVVSRSSLLNNMRLNAIWGWVHPEYFPYASGYDSNLLEYTGGFLLIVLAALSLCFAVSKRRRRVAAYCMGIGLVALFISKGLHPPFAGVNAAFYRLPLTALFREATSKTPVLALLLLSPLAGFALDALRRKFRRHQPMRAGAYATAFTLIIASAFPMVTGAQLHGYTPNYHRDVPGLAPQRVALPAYWDAAIEYLSQGDVPGGVLVLPAESYYQVDYDWGLFGADYLPSWSIHRSVLIPGLEGYTVSPNMAAIDRVIVGSFKARSPLTVKMLEGLGVRFVIYRGDVRRDVPDPQNLTLADVRTSLPRNIQAHSFGPLSIFDLGKALPDLRVTTTFNEGDYSSFDPGTATVLDALTENVPRITQNAMKGARVSVPPLYVEQDISALSGLEQYSGTNLALTRRRIIGNGIIRTRGAPLGGSSKSFPTTFLASFIGQETALDSFYVPFHDFRPDANKRSTLLLSATNVYTDDLGVMHLSIVSPDPDPLTMSIIRVGVLSRSAQEWMLAGDAQQVSTMLPALESPQWATFHNIVLYPGVNSFTLTSAAVSNDAQVSAKADGVRIGDISIPNVVKVPDGRGCIPNYQMCGIIPIGMIPIEAALSTEPKVAFANSSNAGTGIMALLTLRGLNGGGSCVAVPDDNGELDVYQAVSRCLAQHGLGNRESDVSVNNAEFLQFDPSHGVPISTSSLDGVTLSRHASNVTVNSSHAPRAWLDGEELPMASTAEGYQVVVPRGRYNRQRPSRGGQVIVQLLSSNIIRGKLVAEDQSALQVEQPDGSVLLLPRTAVQIITVEPQSHHLHVAWPIVGRLPADDALLLSIDGKTISSARAIFTHGRRHITGESSVSDDNSSATVGFSTGALKNAASPVARKAEIAADFDVSGDVQQPTAYDLQLSSVMPERSASVTVSSRRQNIEAFASAGVARRTIDSSGLVLINSNTNRLAAFALGPAPCECAFQKKIGNIGIVGATRFKVDERKGFITSDLANSGWWVALRYSPDISILKKVDVADGSATWYFDTGGRVAVVNLANVLQLLMMFVGIAVIALRGRKWLGNEAR